jgi:hypothetical protein
MKKIIPAKFVVGVTIFCLIVFPSLAFAFFYVLVDLITVDKLPYYALFLFLVIGLYFELTCLLTRQFNKVIFQNGTVSNYILDGTNNDGWCEELSNVKNVKLAKKDEVQKYYKQFAKGEAILIDFGNYNVKYIYAGLFSKKQIDQIIKLINQEKL